MAHDHVGAEFDFRAILRSGDTVAWPQATGEPLGLTRRLVALGEDAPRGISIFSGMTSGGTVRAEHGKHFRFVSTNGLGTNRKLVDAGLMDIIPVHVSQVPSLLRARVIPVDVALIRVRPTDDPSLLSCGVVADYTRALVEAARVVVGELDDRLPITGQDALIPRHRIHHLVTQGPDEVLMPDPEPSAQDMAVARRVAAFIPDRATVQLGIGRLPVAVGRALLDHRDLGMHGGVVSDFFVDLVERGVVTNGHKGIDPGVSVTGCLFGTRRLVSHAHRNSALALRSVEYTHALSTLASIRALYSVNGAIEVDLTGQVNAEEAGGRYVGAVGGQLDFVRGAALSPGGRSVIALASTTPDGSQSRIVARLEGDAVTTGRADVDAIITEHGVAELRGVGLAERVRRLIRIADPKFREALERDAAGPGRSRAAA